MTDVSGSGGSTWPAFYMNTGTNEANGSNKTSNNDGTVDETETGATNQLSESKVSPPPEKPAATDAAVARHFISMKLPPESPDVLIGILHHFMENGVAGLPDDLMKEVLVKLATEIKKLGSDPALHDAMLAAALTLIGLFDPNTEGAEYTAHFAATETVGNGDTLLKTLEDSLRDLDEGLGFETPADFNNAIQDLVKKYSEWAEANDARNSNDPYEHPKYSHLMHDLFSAHSANGIHLEQMFDGELEALNIRTGVLTRAGAARTTEADADPGSTETASATSGASKEEYLNSIRSTMKGLSPMMQYLILTLADSSFDRDSIMANMESIDPNSESANVELAKVQAQLQMIQASMDIKQGLIDFEVDAASSVAENFQRSLNR